jgi:predicted enzyme related to lactoylglutathione lyase
MVKRRGMRYHVARCLKIKMTIQFTSVSFVTHDVPRLRAFYEAVFGVKAEGDETHSSLRAGGAGIVIVSAGLSKIIPSFHHVSAQSSDNTIVSFGVADVDAEHARLLALDTNMLNEPTTHPWGARSFPFTDPDGNILNFHSIPA